MRIVPENPRCAGRESGASLRLVCFCIAIVSTEKRFDSVRRSRLPPIVFFFFFFSPLKLSFVAALVVAATTSCVCVLISDPDGLL